VVNLRKFVDKSASLLMAETGPGSWLRYGDRLGIPYEPGKLAFFRLGEFGLNGFLAEC